MATTTNYSWTTPDDTALVKDGAAAIRSLGTAIDTTVFNNANAAIAKTIVDAKGDLIVGTAADTVARLASSASNGNILTVDTSTATGLKWAAPAGGSGMTLITSQDFTTSSNISVNDVFSATYLTYMVIISCTPTSTFDADLRFRVSGSDDSSANYFNYGMLIGSGGISASTPERGATYFRIAGAELATGSSLCQMLISAPFATRQTLLFTQNTNKERYKTQNGLFDGTTSFTGFSFFPNANNMTGNVRVYGLANS